MNRTFPFVIGLLLAGLAAEITAAELAIRREADRLVVTEAGGEPVAAFVFADPAGGRPAIRDLAAPGARSSRGRARRGRASMPTTMP